MARIYLIAQGIAITPDGAVLVAGYIGATSTFGSGTAHETMTATPLGGAYVARYGTCADD